MQILQVEYSLENMLKCVCCKCEVQTHSKCARERTEKIQKIEAKGLKAIPVFKPKEFPWIYCSIGKAECPRFSVLKRNVNVKNVRFGRKII